jgi:enamine deaminase RidA (YjgF/YER057c/UK114 family)
MNRGFNPDGIAAPASPYSHGVETPPNARWLHTAGQVGILPDGSVPGDALAQNHAAWANLKAILAGANMDIGDIVRVNVFLTSPEGIAPYREARAAALGDHRPASTLLIVAGLASPDFKVEIEMIAAKA